MVSSSLQPFPTPWNSFHHILGCSPQPPPCNTRLLLRLRFPRLPAYDLLLPSLATLRSCLKWSLPVSLAFPLPPKLVSSSPRVSALYPKSLGGWMLSLSVSLKTHGLSPWIICPYLSLSLSLSVSKLGLPRWCGGKNPHCQCRRHKILVQSLGWKDPLEEEMASHSSILAWKIPRTEEPGGLYLITEST